MAENDAHVIASSNNGTKSGENDHDSDTEHNSDNEALYDDNINSLGANKTDNNINNNINAINIARIASVSGDRMHSGIDKRSNSKYISTLWIGLLCIILTIHSLSIVYLLFIKSDNCTWQCHLIICSG